MMSQRDEIRQELEELASQYETLPRYTIDFAMGMIDRIAMQYPNELFPEEDKSQLVRAVDNMMFKRNADKGQDIKQGLLEIISDSTHNARLYNATADDYQRVLDVIGLVKANRLEEARQNVHEAMRQLEEKHEQDEPMDGYMHFIECQFPGLDTLRLQAMEAMQKEEAAYSRMTETAGQLLEKIRKRTKSPAN